MTAVKEVRLDAAVAKVLLELEELIRTIIHAFVYLVDSKLLLYYSLFWGYILPSTCLTVVIPIVSITHDSGLGNLLSRVVILKQPTSLCLNAENKL